MGFFHDMSIPLPLPTASVSAASSRVILGRPKCALIKYSRPPWNCLIVHTTQSLSGKYVTLPTLDLKLGLSTSGGTGIEISTLFATDRDLNCDRVLIMYSIRDPRWGSTTASTQINGFTCVSNRYVIKSNSPSGGMNEMVLSFSNRARRTH